MRCDMHDGRFHSRAMAQVSETALTSLSLPALASVGGNFFVSGETTFAVLVVSGVVGIGWCVCRCVVGGA